MTDDPDFHRRHLKEGDSYVIGSAFCDPPDPTITYLPGVSMTPWGLEYDCCGSTPDHGHLGYADCPNAIRSDNLPIENER